jgi:hypothetical protein
METEAGFKVTGPRSSTITGPEMRLTAGKPRLRNNNVCSSIIYGWWNKS